METTHSLIILPTLRKLEDALQLHKVRVFSLQPMMFSSQPMPEGGYVVESWRAQLQRISRGDWKAPLMALARPLLHLNARRHLPPEARRRLHPDLILLERGMPMIARRRWADRARRVRDSHLLIQGTGNGWDAAHWAQLLPAQISAVDLFPFESWAEISRWIKEQWGIRVEFQAAPLDALSFLPDASVDLAASDAVFEHVRDLGAALRETWRILKPGGLIYAAYGPLWYAPGGDHFSGAGGLAHSYNHLLLDPPEYQAYFERFRHTQPDFQSGGRYVELDLFSRLRTEEYLALYQDCGFKPEGLIVELSERALDFRAQHPALFARLQERHPQCRVEDFLIKTHMVRLRKSG
ncbi:MAG: class I SAM-dependent methyltransferase [Anaerolineae bacterium]|nr:class I SAM-dependent methyltransferase [Anaerolineae bacterium]